MDTYSVTTPIMTLQQHDTNNDIKITVVRPKYSSAKIPNKTQEIDPIPIAPNDINDAVPSSIPCDTKKAFYIHLN